MAFSTFARLSKTLLNKLPQTGLLLNRNLSLSHVTKASCLLRRPNAFLIPQTPALYQSIQKAHTKGDVELTEFLQSEIEAEKSILGKQDVATTVEGFELQTNEAEVILKKTHGNEKIEISLNVNNSVDQQNQEPIEDNEGASLVKGQGQSRLQPDPKIQAKPNFTVQIEKKGTKLGFNCSFIENEESEGGDLFQIDEVFIFENEWSESNYIVSSEMMDGYLYDLLMNMLSERGISNEFANNLVNFTTSYEHNLYVSLLEKFQKFIN